jgi:hypothetical protein
MKMKIVSSTAFGTQMSFSQMCRYCTLGSRFYGQTTMLAKIRSKRTSALVRASTYSSGVYRETS